MSDAEGEVMDALIAAAECFNELEEQHPNEVDEFFAAIHRAQDMLAVRICRRAYPEGWPTYG